MCSLLWLSPLSHQYLPQAKVSFQNKSSHFRQIIGLSFAHFDTVEAIVSLKVKIIMVLVTLHLNVK